MTIASKQCVGLIYEATVAYLISCLSGSLYVYPKSLKKRWKYHMEKAVSVLCLVFWPQNLLVLFFFSNIYIGWLLPFAIKLTSAFRILWFHWTMYRSQTDNTNVTWSFNFPWSRVDIILIIFLSNVTISKCVTCKYYWFDYIISVLF